MRGDAIKSSELKASFFTFVFLFFSILSFTQPRTINVVANFKIEDGNFDGSYLVQENTTTGEKQTIPGQGKFSLTLKFNADYILSFVKPGYITKKIEFNTSAPDDRIAQGFYPIMMTVILIKQYEGVNIVVFNQPVSKYRYSSSIDEFGFDTDYTKQIQAQLKEAEDELDKKKTQEKANSAANAKASELAKQDSIVKAKAEAKAKLDQDQKAKAEAKAEFDQDAKLRTDSLAQAKRELLAKEEEDKRQQAKAKMEEDEREKAMEKLNAEDREKAAKAQAEEDARKRAQAKLDADEHAKSVKLQTEEDTRKKNQERVDEEQKRKTLANAQGSNDSKRSVAVSEGDESRKNANASPNYGNDPKLHEKPTELPADVKIEEVKENNRTVIKVIVTNNTKEVTYYKIIYKWGGVFFYKGTLPISQSTYQLATNLK